MAGKNKSGIFYSSRFVHFTHTKGLSMIEAGIFIPDHDLLQNLVASLKAAGLRVVLTQGAYDLVHNGHCEYLRRARAEGDILIVGVDSDAKVKKRKGENRPIVPENERVNILTYLRAVDFVTVKHVDEEHLGLLKKLRPDVLVVSESTSDREFTAEKIAEMEQYCGKVVVLPPQSITSTSSRVRQITLLSAEDFKNALAEKIPRLLEVVQKELLGEEK